MIRVLHVVGGMNMGGVQSFIMNYYRNIDRENVQFDFIVHTKEKCYFDDEIQKLGGRIFHFPRFNGRNLLEMIRVWNNFFSSNPEYKILHSHIRSYASLYLPIARKHGLKTIIHSHSTSNGKGILSYAKKIMQFPLRYQADYFIGCSKEAGEWLFGKNTLKNKKYIMLQNAICVKNYRFDPDIREKTREELEVADKTVFIHIGRFHEAKNHLFLLELFSEIVSKKSKAVLIIAGDGELRPQIEATIKERHLEQYTQLLGARKDIPELLMAADCFLFPSKWEGLPVTVVEAQSSGIPCLISKTITNDVVLSHLVRQLPIDEGVRPWCDEIERLDFCRDDVSEKVIDAGFDVETSVNTLCALYREALN